HPYGQIPGSWVLKLPSVLDASQPIGTTTVSTVGRQWTTFWDVSKGPELAGHGDTFASMVQPSGIPICLSESSQLSSLPSAASSPKDYTILQWLTEILKMMSKDGESPNITLSLYLPVSQIYDELLQVAVLLFAQKDNPGYLVFMNHMVMFCNIIAMDFYWISL
ncbi:hypothetical protein DFH29DRAFT_871730, partial [Suillus ampliporus]